MHGQLQLSMHEIIHSPIMIAHKVLIYKPLTGQQDYTEWKNQDFTKPQVKLEFLHRFEKKNRVGNFSYRNNPVLR